MSPIEVLRLPLHHQVVIKLSLTQFQAVIDLLLGKDLALELLILQLKVPDLL